MFHSCFKHLIASKINHFQWYSCSYAEASTGGMNLVPPIWLQRKLMAEASVETLPAVTIFIQLLPTNIVYKR
jgi:hypothetical protein